VTPEQAFADLLSSEPSRPFVTYYDEARSERSELSVKSLANWVAKTYHLLGDDLGLGVGDTAFVALPAHWLSYSVLLGCLAAGLALTDDAEPADVGFVTPDTAERAAKIPEVFVAAPEHSAAGLGDDVPDGTADYVTSVRPQQDKWFTVHLAATGADPCLADTARADVLDRAQARADELGLPRGGRLLSTAEWAGAEAWLDALFVPLAIGGSVVLVRNAADETLTRRAEQERADLVL
jgi:uncharacterized protein (TIGR03089 family)